MISISETLENLKRKGAMMSNDEFVVKDSGERQQFDTGAKRDTRTGKGRFDLISPIMLRRLAVLMEKGAVKYGPRNWEKGLPQSRVRDSALRHINNYREGLRDEDHVIQAIFNLMAIVHQEELCKAGLLPKELLDLPSYAVTVQQEK